MLNGDGLRVVLWVAGCAHCCKGCQNPVTWDPDGGLLFDQAAKEEIFEQLDRYTPCGHRTAVSLRAGSVGYAFWQEEFLRQTQEFLADPRR